MAEAHGIGTVCLVVVLVLGLGCASHASQSSKAADAPGTDIGSVHTHLLDLERDVMKMAGRSRVEPEAECRLLAMGIEPGGEICSYVAYAPTAANADSLVHMIEQYNEGYLAYRDRVEDYFIMNAPANLFDPCFGAAPPDRPSARVEEQQCVTVPFLLPPIVRELRQRYG